TQLDLTLQEGAALGEVEQTLQSVVAGRGVVERPQARGAGLERLMRGQRYATVATSVSAFLVGVILTFGTMVIAVAQRRRHLAVLRLIGMRRGTVFRLVLLEAFSLGLFGALVGVPTGYVLARAAAEGLAVVMRQRFLLPLDALAVDVGSVTPLLLGMVL